MHTALTLRLNYWRYIAGLSMHQQQLCLPRMALSCRAPHLVKAWASARMSGT